MPRIRYIQKRFMPDSRDVIEKANIIIEEYQSQGYRLTLRQLYYQFVARDWLANRQQNYKRLGGILSDARYAGQVDWHAIEDRTRNLRDNSHWDNPGEIITGSAEQYQIDKWSTQPRRVEVWIEKDALCGILDAVCPELDVPYFSCRGFGSTSEMWRAARRFESNEGSSQETVVLHLGDHDPSGINMTEDIRKRMQTFNIESVEIRRIALNMDQVDEYDPPPNPAKETDSRFASYSAEFGDECWELDALEPAVLTQLIRDQVELLRNDNLYSVQVALEAEHREQLQGVADNWDSVVEGLEL